MASVDPAESNTRQLPSVSPPSSTPTPTHPTAVVHAPRQWYAEPQTWQWYYYDPARHRLPGSPSMPFSGPPTPGTAPPVTMNEPILASLKALQTQFTAFQDVLGDVKSDVKDVLSQVDALRTAQGQMNTSIAGLENVIGVSASATGPGPRVRTKRGRGRGRGGKMLTTTEVPIGVPLEGDIDVGVVPEKTLIQTVMSIQSAIEAVLMRLQPPLSSVNQPVGQASERSLDSSREYPTLQSMQTTFKASTSQSEALSPSITTSSPEPANPSSHAAPRKEHANASTSQLQPSLSNSFARTLTIIPVHWNAEIETPGGLVNDPRRTTTSTFQHMTSVSDTVSARQLPRVGDNFHLHSLTASYTQSSPCTTLSSYPEVPNSETRLADSTIPPAIFSSSDASTIPSTSDTTTMAETSPTGTSTRDLQSQIQSHTADGADSSLTPFQTRPPGDLQLSSLSQSGSLSRIATSLSLANNLIQAPSPSTEGRGSLTMTSPQNGLPGVSQTLLTSPLRPMMAAGTTESRIHVDYLRRPQAGSGREDTQMGSDREGDAIPVTGGATTASGSLPTHSSLADADDGGLPSSLSTSPSEATGADDLEHGTAANSQITSPSVDHFPAIRTPASLTPEPLAVGMATMTSGRLVSESSLPPTPLAPVHMTTKEVSTDDARSSLRTNQTHVNTLNLAISVINLTNEPRSMDEDASRIDQAVDDLDPAYSPSRAYGNGYDFHFSSPPRHTSPPTSPTPTPSRYATPLETSDMHPAPDEDEVWHVLMLGASGVSTPESLPMMFSRAASLAAPSSSSDQGQPLLVDPAVLQLRGSPQTREGSLSSLTSLAESEDGRTDGTSVEVTGAVPAESPTLVASPKPSQLPRSGARPSEPHKTPRRPPSSTLAKARRATSEAPMRDRLTGGPGASLEELAMLARKPAPRRWTKILGGIRGVKRKRDGDDGNDGDEDEEDVSRRGSGAANDNEAGGRNNEPRLFGDDDGVRVDEDGRAGQGDGGAPPARIETKAIMPPVSNKVAKKTGERHHRKPKRMRKTDGTRSVTYHVRNGQIVAMAVEPEKKTQTQVPTTPPPPRPKQGQDVPMSSRVGDRKGQGNQVMKNSRPSPGLTIKLSPRGARIVQTPRTKEMKSPSSRRPVAWPALPGAHSHWDAQFIQCDDCDNWYHYGCVAVKVDDPRLEQDAMFSCPACQLGTYQGTKWQMPHNHVEACARPDCPEPQVTGESELYFVERLVGRKKVEGYMYMWLAKWEGYPMSQATWIPKENVVGGDTRLFDTFFEEAVGEGVDLSGEVVLLREAIDAGWKA